MLHRAYIALAGVVDLISTEQSFEYISVTEYRKATNYVSGLLVEKPYERYCICDPDEFNA